MILKKLDEKMAVGSVVVGSNAYEFVLKLKSKMWDIEAYRDSVLLKSSLLKDWKLYANDTYKIEEVIKVSDKAISDFLDAITGDMKDDDVLLIKKLCGTCKYWSGKRVFGCVAGHCDMVHRNKMREDKCSMWEY